MLNETETEEDGTMDTKSGEVFDVADEAEPHEDGGGTDRSASSTSSSGSSGSSSSGSSSGSRSSSGSGSSYSSGSSSYSSSGSGSSYSSGSSSSGSSTDSSSGSSDETSESSSSGDDDSGSEEEEANDAAARRKSMFAGRKKSEVGQTALVEYTKIELKCATLDDVMKGLDTWPTETGRTGCCRTIIVSNLQQRLKHKKELVTVRGECERAVQALQDGIDDKYMVIQRELDALRAAVAKAEKRVTEVERQLKWWTFGDRGLGRIRKSMQTNRHLEYLDLHNNEIGDAGAEDLASALTFNKVLVSLNLSNNRIGPEGAIELVRAVTKNKSSALRRLNLHRNRLGVEGGVGVADMLADKRARLEELNVRNNNIGDDGATAFGDMLSKNTHLKRLNLSTNNIDIEGLEAVVDGLVGNSVIKVLDLSYNKVLRTLRKNEHRPMIIKLTGMRVIGILKNYWEEAEPCDGGRGEELVEPPYDWNWRKNDVPVDEDDLAKENT